MWPTQASPIHRWTFLKMNIKQLVDNWYVGSKEHCVPPLKILEPLHVQHLGTVKNKNQGRVKLRQMKLIMTKIEEYATIEGVYDGNPANGHPNTVQSYGKR